MTAAAFRATYSDWRLIKGRKVVQVVFELPLEQADQAYDALGGMPNPAAEVWCGIARLVQPAERTVVQDTDNSSRLHAGQEQHVGPSPDKTRPALESIPAPVRAKVAPQKRLAQLAGMLAKTPLFHRWIEQTTVFGNVDEENAAQFIRNYCGVESRSELLPGEPAGTVFLQLYDKFKRWEASDQYVEAS